MHIRQTGIIYSACGPYTKTDEKIQEFLETSDLKHIYKNKLDNACLADVPAYSDSTDLATRII